MEIKVGIQHIAREVLLDTTATAAEIEAAFDEAMGSGGLLTLRDDRGRKVLIPADKIGYLDLGEESARRVGFGTP